MGTAKHRGGKKKELYSRGPEDPERIYSEHGVAEGEW
jgi:hypothetical protein